MRLLNRLVLRTVLPMGEFRHDLVRSQSFSERQAWDIETNFLKRYGFSIELLIIEYPHLLHIVVNVLHSGAKFCILVSKSHYPSMIRQVEPLKNCF